MNLIIRFLCRNLLVYLLFIFLSINKNIFQLQSNAWAKSNELKTSSYLSMEDKIKLLISLKKKYPNLSTDAALYKINLIKLLDHQEKLLNFLNEIPTYEDSLNKKKLFEIKILSSSKKFLPDNINYNDNSLSNWKNDLKDKLMIWTKRENLKEIEFSTKKIKNALETSILNDKDLYSESGVLVKKILFKLKKSSDGSKIKKELNFNKHDALYEKISKIYQFALNHPSAISAFVTPEEIKKLKKWTESKNDFTLNSFYILELWNIFAYIEKNNLITITNLDQAHLFIEKLTASDLYHFLEKDLFPLTFSNQIQLSKNELEKLSKQIKSYYKENYHINAVRLEEVTPIQGIFRGCVGDDCSTQYSFPYPNDPYEKVFLVYDELSSKTDPDHLKGYVNATQIKSNGKLSLYVHTISGKKISSIDTKLILIGLDNEEIKKHLGVEQIIIPEIDRISSFNNFFNSRSIFKYYAVSQPIVPIEYQGRAIRKFIETFDSKFNDETEDHQSKNKNGIVLSLNSEEKKKIKAYINEIANNGESTNELSLPINEVYEFALDMLYSEKFTTLMQLFEVPSLTPFNENFANLISQIQNTSKDSVEIYLSKIKNIFLERNINFDFFIRNKYYLFKEGLIKSSNAFHPDHIDNTITILLSDIKQSNSNYYCNLIKTHEDTVSKNLIFQNYKKELLNQLSSDDNEEKINGFRELTLCNIRIENISLFQEALQNEDARVASMSALSLDSYYGEDDIQLYDLAFSSNNLNVKINAITSLKKYQGQNAYDIFSKALFYKHLNFNKLRRLPNSVKVFKKFSSNHIEGYNIVQKWLESDDNNVRNNAITLIHPLLKGNIASLFEKAFSHPDFTTREYANDQLKELDLTSKEVLLQFLKSKNETILSIIKYRLSGLKFQKNPYPRYIKDLLLNEDESARSILIEALGGYEQLKLNSSYEFLFNDETINK